MDLAYFMIYFGGLENESSWKYEQKSLTSILQKINTKVILLMHNVFYGKMYLYIFSQEIMFGLI